MNSPDRLPEGVRLALASLWAWACGEPDGNSATVGRGGTPWYLVRLLAEAMKRGGAQLVSPDAIRRLLQHDLKLVRFSSNDIPRSLSELRMRAREKQEYYGRAGREADEAELRFGWRPRLVPLGSWTFVKHKLQVRSDAPQIGGELVCKLNQRVVFRSAIVHECSDVFCAKLTETGIEAACALRIGIQTAGEAVPGSQPDATGFVAAPPDLSAYVPASVIISHHSPPDRQLTSKTLAELVEDYPRTNVRWTRPPQKSGEPRHNRRLVHLTDWYAYRAHVGNDVRRGGSDGWPRMGKAEIAERKDAIRRRKSADK